MQSKRTKRAPKSRDTRLAQAYNIAIHAIARITDVSARLEDFDEEMEGSSITDELNAIVDKAHSKMMKTLNKNFKLLGFKPPRK